MFRRYLSQKCLVIAFVGLLIIGCAPRQTRYASESLDLARMAASTFPELSRRVLDIPKDEKETETDVDRYKQMLEQKFQFSPPVTILLIIPPTRRLYWWDEYHTNPKNTDSLNAMLFKTLSEGIIATDYVNDLKLASSIFNFGTLDGLQELAARYRADECLLVSYDLLLIQPRFCLGFWPASYLIGDLSMETILLDTRTGFILMSKEYSCVRRTSFTMLMTSNKELEVIKLIVPELVDSIVGDLATFYKKESE